MHRVMAAIQLAGSESYSCLPARAAAANAKRKAQRWSGAKRLSWPRSLWAGRSLSPYLRMACGASTCTNRPPPTPYSGRRDGPLSGVKYPLTEIRSGYTLGAVNYCFWCYLRMNNTPAEARLAGLSTQERQILGALVAAEATGVTVEDVLRAFPMPRSSANQIISRLQRKGWLNRVRRGVYAIVPLEAATTAPAIEHAWPLAMELFDPCYVSGWSAAEHWDLTEQIFNSVCIVTAHKQRSALQVLGGITFRTRTIPKSRLFGTRTLWFGSRKAEVADPHRLLIDVLDAPDLGGGGRHTIDIVRAYWKSPHRDPTILLEYAKRYGRGSVFKRLGFTAERFGNAGAAWLAECHRNAASSVIRLDPASPSRGSIITRWGIRVNIPVDPS